MPTSGTVRSGVAPRSPRRPLLALLVSTTLLGGCANLHSTFRRGDLTVHTFRLAYNNVHVVRSASGLVVIDSGLERDAPRLLERLRSIGVRPERVKLLILTHGHADHAGGARLFQQRYHTPVMAGAGDRALLGRGRNRYLCPTGLVARRRLAETSAERFTPVRASVWVRDELNLRKRWGIEAIVRPVPGHTPGSLWIDFPRAKVAFVGDMFRGGILIPTWPAVHFYHCDLARNRRNIRRLLEVSDAGTFFTGHFGPIARKQLSRLLGVLKRRLHRRTRPARPLLERPPPGS